MTNQNNIPRQYQTGLVNIIGVNNSGGAATRPQAPVQMPQPQGLPLQDVQAPQYNTPEDITDPAFEQIRRDSEERYKILQDAINSQQRFREVMAQNKATPPRMYELAAVFDTVANAGLSFYQIQEEKKQRQLGQMQQLAAGYVEQNFYESQIQAEENIKKYGDEYGVNTLESDVDSILTSDAFRSLPPEQQTEIASQMRSYVIQRKREQTQAYVKTQQDIQAAQTNAVRANLEYGYAGYISRAKNPSLPADMRQQVLMQGAQFVMDNTTEMDAVTRLTVLSDYWGAAADAEGASTEVQVLAAQKQYDLLQFLPQAEQARASYGNDPVAWRQWLFANAPESIREEALALFPDNRTITQDNINYQESLQNFEDGQRRRANTLSYGNITAETSINSLNKAFSILQGNDPGAENYYRTLQAKPAEERTAEESLVLSIVQQARDAKEQIYKLRNELQGLYQELDGATIKFQRGSEPRESTYRDPDTGQVYRVFVTDPNTGEVVYVRSDISSVTLESLKQQIDDRNYQINELRDTTLAETGYDITNPASTAGRDRIINAFTAAGGNPQLRDELGNLTGQPKPPSTQYEQSRQNTSGFNWSADEPAPGHQSGQPPVNNLATYNGSPIPFAQSREGEITVTSGYGNRVHPIHGETRFHDGVDFASDTMYTEDVGALSVQGGYVIDATNWNGYGGTVFVSTPTGEIEQYSHLRAFQVKPGDYVQPGQVLGIVGGAEGDPMAGTSTGRHLHFSVYASGTENYEKENMLDPLSYLETVQLYENVPMGTGSSYPQSGSYPTSNTIPAYGGNALLQNAGDALPYLSAFITGQAYTTASAQVPVEQVYPDSGQAQPLVNASIHRDAYTYPNDPSRNYQYEVLDQDKEFARALAEVADELGIPAVWLADLMAYETGHTFDPGELGPEVCDPSFGCSHGVGLIQIMTFNLPAMGLTETQVANMSRAEYTRTVVRKFLQPWAGQMNTIDDLSSVIFTGSLGATGDESDGYHTMSEYRRSLGSGVGRRYEDDRQASLLHPYHEEYTTGCDICSQQYTRYGTVIPHESYA